MLFHLTGLTGAFPSSSAQFPVYFPLLPPAPAGEARETSERGLESDPSYPVSESQSPGLGLGNYNSQRGLRQRRRRRLRQRHGGGRFGGVSCALIGQVQPLRNLRKTRAETCACETGFLQTGFLRLVVAAAAAWISASWRETIRAAVA